MLRMIDRKMFIGWSKGELLRRDGKGNVFAVDEIACQEAEDAMDKGETIFLTVKGKPRTKMALKGDSYVEEEVSPEEVLELLKKEWCE